MPPPDERITLQLLSWRNFVAFHVLRSSIGLIKAKSTLSRRSADIAESLYPKQFPFLSDSTKTLPTETAVVSPRGHWATVGSTGTRRITGMKTAIVEIV